MKRLCVLPYDLTVDEPSPESVKHVIEFAKKTGDYLSLSAADVKVIALTYQLEKELVGEAHLRINPVLAKTIASRDKPPELIERAPLAGFYMPPNKEQLIEKTELIKDLTIETSEAKEKSEHSASEEESTDDLSETEEELAESLKQINVTTVEADNILVSIKEDNSKEHDKNETSTEEGIHKNYYYFILFTMHTFF